MSSDNMLYKSFQPEIEQLPPDRWRHRVFPSAQLPKYNQDRLTFAFHESAHAVFWVALGGEIESVELNAAGGLTKKHWPELLAGLNECGQSATPQEGNTEARQEKWWRSSAWMAAEALSGRQAELILHRIPFTGVLLEHSSDQRAALWHLDRAALPHCAIGYCQLLARSTIEAYWPWVATIAEALNRKGKLERGEIGNLLLAMHDTETDAA